MPDIVAIIDCTLNFETITPSSAPTAAPSASETTSHSMGDPPRLTK